MKNKKEQSNQPGKTWAKPEIKEMDVKRVTKQQQSPYGNKMPSPAENEIEQTAS